MSTQIRANFIPLEKIQSSTPSEAQELTLENLNGSLRQALDRSHSNLENAFNPRNGTLISGVLLTHCDDEDMSLDGTNFNAAYGARDCAERAMVYRSHSQQQVKALVLIAARVDPEIYEPPAFPCGTCRTLLASLTQESQLARIMPESIFLTSDSLRQKIYQTSFESLLPLTFINRDLTNAETIAKLSKVGLLTRSNQLEYLSIPLSALAKYEGYFGEGLSGELILQMRDKAQEFIGNSIPNHSGVNSAATVLTASNRMFASRANFGIDNDFGQPAALGAIRIATERKSTFLKAVLILSDGPSKFGGPFEFDGRSAQYIFDCSQRSGIDLPVIFVRTDSDRVFIAKSSDLVPMAEGIADSRKAAENLPPLLLDGKVIS